MSYCDSDSRVLKNDSKTLDAIAAWLWDGAPNFSGGVIHVGGSNTSVVPKV